MDCPIAQRLLLTLGLAVSFCTSAQTVQFTDTSVSLLHGSGFEIDPRSQSTLTVEQASGWTLGDLYWFVDATHYARDDSTARKNTWYGELSPRLSLAKLSGHPIKAGPAKDILIAATYERGRDRKLTESALLGLGADLSVPGFDYFQANVYSRKNVHRGGWDTWQLTLAGSRPFALGAQHFVVDGFLDYVANGGPHSGSLHFVPQIKWDLGNALGHRHGQLWLGAEVDLWRNKYGIADSARLRTDQVAASVMLRWHP